MMKVPTFLKWVGGKRRLIQQIDPSIPHKINTYFEPFLGGGSMFFYIKQKYNPKKCVLSDINRDLIETFKAVRDSPKELIKELNHFKRNNSKEFFYNVRIKFNEGKFEGLKRCATFIYMNKTCFNGLWRVNSQNKFNVPFGKYKNPEIFNEETILLASQLLQGVKIVCQDYRKVLDDVKRGDFVYLDPCYDPLKKTSFANYCPERFCELDRIELSKCIGNLWNKNVSFALSNNNLPIIRKIYSSFNIREVWASRSINSIGKGRGKVKELLVIG